MAKPVLGGPRPLRHFPWMLLGEKPGWREAKAGEVWIGEAGSQLDQYLFMASLLRESFFITNLLKYQTPGDSEPTKEMIERDFHYLKEEFDAVKPQVVATLGRPASRFLLGDVDMESCHGLPVRGGNERLGWEGVVIPCYNPAAGIHSPEDAIKCQKDIEQLALYLKGKIGLWDVKDPYAGKEKYVNWAPRIGATLLQSVDRDSYIDTDTEGTPKAPYCLTFSVKPGEAYLIYAKDKVGVAWFSEFIKDKVVAWHNSLWDLEVTRAMGIPDHKFVDTMVMAYPLAMEPQGLKPLCKRHLNMEMHSFTEVTDPYRIPHERDFFEKIAAGSWQDPGPEFYVDTKSGENKQRWPQNPSTRAKRALTDLAKGGDVKLHKRWKDLPLDSKAEVESVIGGFPEFTFDWVPEEVRRYYGCRDADGTGRIRPILHRMVLSQGLEAVLRLDTQCIPMVAEMQREGMPGSRSKFEELGRFLRKDMRRIEREIAAYNGGVFVNPNSGDQVAELLFDKLGVQSKRMTKKRTRLATDEKALKAIRLQHPCVELVVQHRERSKLHDSFADNLPKMIEEDGRIRGAIRVTRTSSGRLSMTGPNLMAIPQRTELGRRIRKGFVAPPGWVIMSTDFDQIEMRGMADESGDERMIDLFRRGEDIHCHTAADIFGVPIDATRKGQPGEKLYRDPAKRIGFGVITGITGHGLMEQLLLNGLYHYGTDVKVYEDMIRDWFKVYPGVKAYQLACRAEAKRRGYVKCRWGRPRYLPSARSYVDRLREEALRQAHSHKIQSGAQGLLKDRMVALWETRGSRAKNARFLLQIHDELLLLVRKSKAKVYARWVKATMEGNQILKVPVLASVSWGPTWGDAK